MNPFNRKTDEPALFITADYELFLGSRSGTIANCLLLPTDQLAALVERYGRRLVLFIDVFFLNRLKDDALHDDALAKVRGQLHDQLQNLVGRGHHLGLHTHPQWLTAERVGNEWRFPPNAPYRLQDLPEEDSSDPWHSIEGSLRAGKQMLDAIAGKAVPGYDVQSFRAGGLCLQPFSALSRALAANHLVVDSSIAPGCFLSDGARRYDYRGTPQRDSWRFENDPLLEDPRGNFVEMPIATFRATMAARIRTRMVRFWANGTRRKTWGDGHGRPMPKANVLKRLFAQPPAVLSYDYWDAQSILKRMRKVHQSGHRRVILLGHPKYLSPLGLDQLEIVLQTATREGWA